MKKYIDLNYIKTVGGYIRFRVNINNRDDRFYIERMENDVSYYLNNWKLV